jgi:hypothetical protein
MKPRKKEREKRKRKRRTKEINRERWWANKQCTRQTLREKKVPGSGIKL